MVRPASACSFVLGGEEKAHVRGQSLLTNRPSPLHPQYGHAKKSTYTLGDYLGIMAQTL